tara:strand:- start:59 stop:1558 length:1500 start_codon:yes stop_codon:yes gene_type:complete
MAYDTTIDNEGIKKGLGLVVSQLIQSNKKLGDLNEPNLLKAFKENQAEILASYAQHRQEMAVAREELDYQKKVTKGLKNFSVTKAGVQVDETGKERRPNVEDTLFGQMAQLVKVLKAYTDYDMKIQKESAEASLDTYRAEKKKKEEEKKLKVEERKEKLAERVVNRGFFASLLKTTSDNEKTNVNVLERLRYLRELPKKLQQNTNVQTLSLLDANKNLRANFGSGLGRLYNYFFNSDKKKEGKEESRFKKLGKGLVSIVKTIKNTFMKYLGNPFLLLIKGIGLALLTAGVFKFFASPAWQKMKPNIAKSIGDGLAVMDKALDKLIEAIPVVVDGLKTMASGLMTAINFIAEITGFKGKNVRGEIEEQVRIDLPGHDETVIQAEIDKRVRLARKQFIKDLGEELDEDIKNKEISFEKADEIFAKELRKFDADTYGAYISGDKIMLSDADLKRHKDMVGKMQSNFSMANQNNQVNNNPTYTRYIQSLKNQSHFSNLNNQVD